MPAFAFAPKAAPPAPVVTARAKRMVIDITPSSDTERVSCEVRRYASATDAANDERLITGIGGSPYLTGGGQYLRTPATYQKRWTDVVELRVTDHDDLTDGAEYVYAIFEIDKYGNRSLTSATDSAVYRLVESTDIGANAVVPSKQIPRDYSNLIRDGEMLEPDLWTIVNGSTPTQEINAIGGPGKYQLVFTRSNTSDVYARSEAAIPVVEGKAYSFQWHFSAVSSPSSSFSIYHEVDWYDIDSGGDLSLISTSSSLVFSGSGEDKFNETLLAPAYAQVARSSVRFVNATQPIATLKISSPIAQRLLYSIDLYDFYYQRETILGTVSQLGGTPTGAIIEAGSNANGYYTKFADGTMICRYLDSGVLNSNTASGSGYISSSTATWTFPAAFSDASGVVCSGMSGIGRWVTFNAPTTTTVEYRHNSFISLTTGTTRLQAIGRWF